MLEIVKVVLETLSKILSPSEISKLMKEKKLNDLGTKLFLIYFYLNEVLVNGEDIVSSLEVYVERMQRHITYGDDSYALTGGRWISFKLLQQRLSLAKLGRAIQSLSEELQLINADVYRQIYPLLKGKVNVLDSLLKILGNGALPLNALTEQELISFIEEESRIGRSKSFSSRKALASRLEESSIPSIVPWDENVFYQIKEYLDKSKPREQLKDIQDVAEQLKKTLESYFSISDILLKVGDKKLDIRYDGDYFW